MNEKPEPRPGTSPASTRQRILDLLKARGTLGIGELANELHVTREAARQQLALMESQGWVRREARQSGGKGRPPLRFVLSEAAEHLFPKHYDALAVQLVTAVGETLGEDRLRDLLAELTDRQVAEWRPSLAGRSLPDKVEALRGIYVEDDPYTDTEVRDGELRLIERNCPFYKVAMAQPRLCSLTVSTLTRLLGHRVVREARFQHGDGRCVFRVLTDQPVDAEDFRFEFERREN
ncbi:MAG: MarR family transcriptional regulator [Gammaproteobacteria bacterium]|jgi:predicted ArsR family transcriptional regulator